MFPLLHSIVPQITQTISVAVAFDYLIGVACKAKGAIFSDDTAPKENIISGEHFIKDVPGAFIGYFGSSIMPSMLEKNYLGGGAYLGWLGLGVLKGLMTSNYLGATTYSILSYNSFSLFNKEPSFLVASSTYLAIESVGGIGNSLYQSLEKNNFSLSYSEEYAKSLLQGMGEGLFSGALVVMIMNTILPILTKSMGLLPSTVTLSLAITLADKAFRQAYANFEDAKHDDSSIIKWIGDAIPSNINFSESLYNNIIDPIFNAPYRLVSQGYDRMPQTLDSFSKLLHAKLGFKDSKSMNGESSQIDISCVNVEKYLIYSTSAGMKLAPDINMVKAYILRADQDNRFGGFSGMTTDSEGNFIFVSDIGSYLKAKPVYQDQVLVGFSEAIIDTFKDSQGLVLTKKNSDIEEVAFFEGDCVVSHERINEFYVYPECNFHNTPTSFAIPEGIKTLPNNEGIEAFSISKQGKVMAIAEYDYNDLKVFHKLHPTFLWTANPLNIVEGLKQFNYISTEGYGVSGMTFLSNGGALVLERTFKKTNIFTEKYWIKVKFISPLTIENVQEGDSIEGKELISIDDVSAYETNGRYSIADNFEAVMAIEDLVAGKTQVFLGSDSNYAPFQEDFLVQFSIDNSLLELV